jgi:hypothetical protein
MESKARATVSLSLALDAQAVTVAAALVYPSSSMLAAPAGHVRRAAAPARRAAVRQRTDQRLHNQPRERAREEHGPDV